MKAKNTIFYQQASNAKSIEVPEGLVVYIDEHHLHYLNPTAATIFLLCATPLADSHLAEILCEEYGLVEPPLAEVSQCLNELLKAKVIEAA